MNSKNYPADLSYFRLSLMAFLRESHPQLANDENFIAARTNAAFDAYEQEIRNGATPNQAAEQANTVLFRDLHFSKHDTLVNIFWNEFADQIPEDQAKIMSIKQQPQCETVFALYPLSDNFAYEPEYELLYTELTGKIAQLLKSHTPKNS